MLHSSNRNHTSLLKRPRSKLLGELSIHRLDLLSFIGTLDTGREPGVFQALNRPEHRDPRGIPRLHGRYQRKLGSCRPWLFFRRSFRLFCIIAVGSFGRTNDWRKQRALGSQGLTRWSGERNDAITTKVVLQIWTQAAWSRKDEDVVVIRS